MAIAPSFTTGLLGYDPREQQLQQQKLWANMYAQAQSPYAQIGMGVGQLLGAGVGMLTGKSAEQKREETLLNLQKEANTKFTPGTPEYYNFIVESIPPEYAEAKAYAAQAAQQATEAVNKSQMERVKYVTENPEQLASATQAPAASAQALINRAVQANNGQPLTQQQVEALQSSTAYQNLIGLTAAQQAGLEKRTGNIGEQVNKEIFNKFLRTAGGDKALAAQLYDEYETNKRVRVSAASATPAPGQVPLTTIKQAQDIIGEYTAKPLEKLNKIQVIATLGRDVKSNPTLLPTFQKELAGFVKDSQISNADFNRAIGSSGIADDAINSVNKFFTGAPTDAKIDDVLKGWKGIEKLYAEQYNTGVKKATTVLEQGKITPETQKAILPPVYNTKAKITAPSVGAVQNGYQFLGGNPADPKSWKAIK